MTEQNKTKVPAELIPAGDYPVVSTDAVMDKQKGKTQEEVNTEAGEKIAALEESVGSGGSVDTRIENAVNTEKARAENVEAQLSNEIDVLQKQDVVPVDSLPSVADADPKKIYRVVGTTSYTDYMVDTMADPTAWKTLATYSFPGIDDTPTAGSEKLVKSGGVLNKISIFKAITPIDYSGDVLECWLSNMPAGRVCLKCYNGSCFLVSPDTTIYSNVYLGNAANGVAYPVKVYMGETEEYPIGTVVGYVMFKDVESFKSKTRTAIWENVSREYCEDLSHSPMIALYLGKTMPATSQNAETAAAATNTTNVVASTVNHSSFVKELYLFGTGVDTTKSYRIKTVARNHSTYKFLIAIYEGSNLLARIMESPEPSNPLLISEINDSGVNAYAIVNWDEFSDGSLNDNLNIELLPRVFDVNYSPVIKNYLRTLDIQHDITGIEGNISDIQDDVSAVQNDIININNSIDAINDIVYDHTDYTRADFKEGYLASQNISIGHTINSFPSDSTPVTAESTAAHLTLEVNEGDIVTSYYKAKSNKYCRAWIFTDKTKKIISWSNPQTNTDPDVTFDYRTEPFLFNVPQDGYLLIQFQQATYTDNAELSIVRQFPKAEPPSNEIKVCVPDVIYAVVGDTLQLYYSSIFRCVDYSKYSVRVVCEIGAQYPRYYEVTPAVGNIGTHSLTFTIKDNNNNILGIKTSSLIVVSSGVNPQNDINILCLGASATSNGYWAAEFKRRLTGNGGNPVASDLSNINFVGRMSKTINGQQVNLEATGGYQFSSYISTSTARYRFNVSSANEPTISIGDVYSNNGNNYTVVEINITAGQGGYFSCEGSGSPNGSGVLTKVSGTGSETITYSSSSFSGNPFVYNGLIDMQHYADDYCNPQQASHGRIDVVYTELFGNGTVIYTDDFTSRMSQMQIFIDQVKAVFPNCKFCIGLFWNPDVRGGLGVNYGATGGWSEPYGIKYSNMNLCNALQKYITYNNLSDYVFILNWLNEFDELNDMQQTAKALNTRYATLLTEVDYTSQMTDTSKVYLLKSSQNTLAPGVYVNYQGVWIQKDGYSEPFGVNGVHPSVIGYHQMADTAWRLFVAKFCQ